VENKSYDMKKTPPKKVICDILHSVDYSFLERRIEKKKRRREYKKKR